MAAKGDGAQQARLAYWTRTLAALDTIPLDQLSSEEKVNAHVFRASIRALANDVKFRIYEAPFNSDTFFWTDFTPRQASRRQARITMPFLFSARCRCLCWNSGWRSLSPKAA